VSPVELRAMLDWFMVSDPWPLDLEKRVVVENLLDYLSRMKGYEGWVDAYHRLLRPKAVTQ
jgi:hypothetical protein